MSKQSQNKSRREFLAASSAFAALGGPAMGKVEKSVEELMTPDAKRAVERGLRFLAGAQVKNGADRGAFGSTGYSGSVGICALAGLAFMAAGNTPGTGKYGKEVDLCTEFLSRNTQKTGYIARTQRAVGNMYGHGFATLFLSQAYGMSRKKEVGEKLKLSIACTLAAQNNEGGWRYQPVKSSADLSVTVCQIMALRAARDAGINVPDKVREKCIDYVKRSQNSDGSFRYTLNGGHSTFALTAAGLVSLFSAGIYEGKAVDKGLTYLKKRMNAAERHYYYYGHYYAVQAMWHAGGDWWNDWFPNIRGKLVKSQTASGAWTDSSYGPEFATAMACIILQMPNDMLPIFAR